MDNIHDFLKDIGTNKDFHGVKLYPSLGFLPSHPNLIPIYEYCVANNIPITVHAAPATLKTYRTQVLVKDFNSGAYIHEFTKKCPADYFFGYPSK